MRIAIVRGALGNREQRIVHTALQPVTGATIRTMVLEERHLAALATSLHPGPVALELGREKGSLADMVGMCLSDDANPGLPLAIARTSIHAPSPDGGAARRIIIHYAEFQPGLGLWLPSVRDAMVACAIMAAAIIHHEDGVPTKVALVGGGRHPGSGVSETLARFSTGAILGEHYGLGSQRSPAPAVHPVTDPGLRRAAAVLRDTLTGERSPTMDHSLEDGTTYSRRLTLSLPLGLAALEEEIGHYADGRLSADWLAGKEEGGRQTARRATGIG